MEVISGAIDLNPCGVAGREIDDVGLEEPRIRGPQAEQQLPFLVNRSARNRGGPGVGAERNLALVAIVATVERNNQEPRAALIRIDHREVLARRVDRHGAART